MSRMMTSIISGLIAGGSALLSCLILWVVVRLLEESPNAPEIFHDRVAFQTAFGVVGALLSCAIALPLLRVWYRKKKQEKGSKDKAVRS